MNIKKIITDIFSHIFNVTPSQWSRVSECWFITFFFKIGAAIGWTIITAAFVAQFGISFLPFLLIINAVLIIAGTIFFERLIMRMKREVLMILMILFGATTLFFSTFLYGKFPIAFFSLVVFAESVFLAQFNVFIPILVGDRFSPLESQKTFPIVESADTVGGIIGGALVGIFASRFAVPWFIYIWVGFLAFVIFVFVIASHVTQTLPSLPQLVEKKKPTTKKDQIKQIFFGIKQIPFFKSLVIIVFFQLVFMNLLEFQYMKAMEQRVTLKSEPTLASVISKSLKADILGIDDISNISVNRDVQLPRILTVQEQTMLTEKLGTFKGIFHGMAFIMQILFASRIIISLGVVGSMLLNPIIMLMSLVGMFLKFGFLSSIITKLNFEASNIVHKNAYFSSHYAFPHYIRDQAAEFLEGVIRPFGAIVGMLLIVGLQIIFSGKDLSMWIHILMFVAIGTTLIETIRLQPRYTAVSRNQLFSEIPDVEKINFIEILAQRGHKEAPVILSRKFVESEQESPAVRMRLVSALGQIRDYDTLPEILEALYDRDVDVRLEAAYALMNFRDLGDKFYMHAFSRFRTIEVLKDVFRNEKSSTVRTVIMRIFSLLKQPDVVSFLLEILESEDSEVRADCIYTLGLFKDPSIAYYILPKLYDENPMVAANAIVALWQFPKYRPMLEEKIEDLLKDKNYLNVKAAIFVIGEIDMKRKKILYSMRHHEHNEIKIEVAFALTKQGDPNGFKILLEYFLSSPVEQFETVKRFLYRLNPKAKKMAERILITSVSDILRDNRIDENSLERLRRLYKLLDHHEELFAVEDAIKNYAPIS